MKFEIPLEHYDDTCYIVGGGSSLKDFNWNLLNDKFVIAINNAYSMLPSASMCYFTDEPWFALHKEELLKHKGVLVKGSLPNNKFAHDHVFVYKLTGHDGMETQDMCLRHGSNSAYAAVNLAAAHLGFKKIYLLGIDMKWGTAKNRNTSHWHSETDPHKRVDGEAIYLKMRQNFATLKKPLLDMGVEVINVNTPDGTDLDVFPIMPPQEVFK